MKEHQLYIQPRQSGKTTTIISTVNEFRTWSTKEFILMPQSISRQYIDMERHGKIKGCDFIPENKFVDFVASQCKSITFFIDEYFMLQPETKKYIFNLMLMAPHKFIAYGTPVKQYTEESARLVSTWWRMMLYRDKNVPILASETVMEQKYGSLMYEMFVNPKVQTIHPHKTEAEKFLSREQYEMQIEGKLFKSISVSG